MNTVSAGNSDVAGLSRTLARGTEDVVTRTAWNILTVERNCEHTTSARLLDRGFTRYLPVQKIRVRQRGKTGFRDLPLFPGYLFLLAGHDRWDEILRMTPGVNGVLRSGECPAILSAEAVGAVKTFETELALKSMAQASKFDFKVGDMVRYVNQNHAFDGVAGTLQRLDKRDIAVIEVILLGRALTSLVTSARHLRRID